MNDLRKAAEMALDALEAWLVADVTKLPIVIPQTENAVFVLRQALAQPEQEPVAWKDKTYGNLHHQNFGNSIPLYTAPNK